MRSPSNDGDYASEDTSLISNINYILYANHEIFIFTSEKFQTPLGRNFQM